MKSVALMQKTKYLLQIPIYKKINSSLKYPIF